MPPKNRISVTRKTHMPNVDASFCCSTLSNWWRSAKVWLANLHLLKNGVVIRLVVDHRSDIEVFRRRRRSRLPLEAARFPRVIRRQLSVAQRPDQVHGRNQISDGKHRCAGGRKHVVDLKFLRVSVIAPRHPQIAHDELREKSQVETEENYQ